MKKKLYIVFGITLIIFLIAGCGKQKESKTENQAYVVVNLEDGAKIEDLFSFTSTANTTVSDYTKMNIPSGPYTIGYTDNGCTLVWLKGADSKFVYVKQNLPINKASIYAQFLQKEDGITYKEFTEQYGESFE